MLEIKGMIERIEPGEAKNGKAYQSFFINTGEENLKVINWGKFITEAGEGDFVVINASPGKNPNFPPRLATIRKVETPKDFQQTIDEAKTKTPEHPDKGRNPANSTVYLSMKIAQDLVGFPPGTEDGNPDMKKHLDNFKEAFEFVKILFETWGL